MGLFGKKRQDEKAESKDAEDTEETVLKEELVTEVVKLQNEMRTKKEENDRLEERVKIVKEEYDATISNLMAVKRELNQKKMELDVAQREHRSIMENIKGMGKITGEKKKEEFVKREADLTKIKEELEKMTEEHARVKEELARGQADLHSIKKQWIGVEEELEEANARLYNAKEELNKKDQFPDTSILTPREKEFIQSEIGGDKSSAGVIEAASAVVSTLKSKLNTTQKELDALQNLLEKEREAHAETRKELNKLKSSAGKS